MINDHQAMRGLSLESQAIKALWHLLSRIAHDSRVGWYLGHGTETFALATEAFANLTGRTVLDIRKEFAPEKPADPAKQALDDHASSLPLLDADVKVLEEVSAHHDTMAGTCALAAAKAGMQLGFGLFAEAEKHEAWSIALGELAARKGGAS